MFRNIPFYFLFALSFSAQTPFGQGETWTVKGFDAFSKGTFEGAGRNLYVSASGRVQLINRFDLNQDGHLDIVIANGHPKSEKEDTFLYLNRGGDFNPLDRVALPTDGAYAAAIADLNKDGHSDLVLAQRNNGITDRLNVFIYWGSADGFSPKRRQQDLPAFTATDVSLADFNGDGWTDIALACENEAGDGTTSAVVYWNSANGFDASRRQDFPKAGWRQLASGDWDSDGVVDLVASGADGVHLYRGTAEGLSTGQKLTPRAESLALADWDSDGTLDLAVADRQSVSVYRHQDAGKDPSLTLDLENVSGLAWADFDQDGRPDLLAAVKQISANEFVDSFILWNGPQGLDQRDRTRLPTVMASCVAAADLNGDHFPEAIFGNHRAYNENNIQSFVYWNSQGTFYEGRKTMLDTRSVTGLAVGDLDQDGRTDLVFTNENGGIQEGWNPNFIYWGDGTRNYSIERRTEIPSYYSTGSVQADLNDDGWVDLGFNEGRYASGRPVTLHGVYLWWGSPDGYTEERRTILSAYDPSGGVKAADLDRNGWLDLLVGAHDSEGGEKGGFVIFWGRAEGYSAQHRQTFSVGSGTREPSLADLNGDGYLDLAVSPMDLNGLWIYWGSSDGYDPDHPTILGDDRQFAHAEAADLNRDGRLDLIAPTRKYAGFTEGDSFVYYGTAQGFSEDNRVGLPTMAGYDPSVGDMNKDGWLDIVFPNYSATRLGKRTLPVFIYWGSSEGFHPEKRQELPADAGTGTLITDFDADGWPDLLVISHRKDGSADEAGKPHTHYANSLIYWNGPDGMRADRRTELPGVGPHAQTVVDIGNIQDREMAEYYVSAPWSPSQEGLRVRRISWEAETPNGTAVQFQVRTAASEESLSEATWVGPAGEKSWFEESGASLPDPAGAWFQFRARFFTPNGGATPYLLSVSSEAE